MFNRLAILLFLASASGFAQEPDPVFKSDTKLALVPFHVTSKDHFVTTVKKEDIELFEDGKPRELTYFENGMTSKLTTPLELLLVFDRSGSVVSKGMLDPLVFQDDLLKGLPNVEISVYSFNQTLRKQAGPTRDPELLRTAFESVAAKGGGIAIPIELPKGRRENKGGTWLYESIIGAAKDSMQQERAATRIMLVFSDGLGTTTAVAEDASKLCVELGIPVYPVLLGPIPKLSAGVTAKGKPKPPSKSDERVLQVQDYMRLGELTGGKPMHQDLLTLDVTRQIVKYLAVVAVTEYVVGFTPDFNETTAKKHKLQVKLKNKELGKLEGGTRAIVH